MREAYVVGVGMTPFARHLDRTHNDLTRESVQKALTDAGAAPEAIELAIYATVAQATMANEQVVPGQFALRAMGFQGLAVINVENACASSSTALHLAHLHVASGQCDARSRSAPRNSTAKTAPGALQYSRKPPTRRRRATSSTPIRT